VVDRAQGSGKIKDLSSSTVGKRCRSPAFDLPVRRKEVMALNCNTFYTF